MLQQLVVNYMYQWCIASSVPVMPPSLAPVVFGTNYIMKTCTGLQERERRPNSFPARVERMGMRLWDGLVCGL